MKFRPPESSASADKRLKAQDLIVFSADRWRTRRGAARMLARAAELRAEANVLAASIGMQVETYYSGTHQVREEPTR